MVRRICGISLALALLSLSGCGPSLDEQYKSAELKHKVASELLDELQTQVDERIELVMRTQCRESIGTDFELLKLEQEKLSALAKLETDVAKLAEFSRQNLEIVERIDQVTAYYQRARQEGTPERQRFVAKMEEFEPYLHMKQQKEVVAKAKQELDELRAKIGS
jgi:hypothetical protein